MKRWANWADAEAELERESQPKQTLKAAQLKFSTKFQRLQYLVSLQPLAEQAAAAAEELQAIQESSAKLTATELKKELKEAAFGPGIENENQLTEANIKSSNGAATTRKDLCGDTTESARAQTIAAFIYCIFSGEQTDGSGNVKYCKSSQAANNNAGTSLTGVETATKDLISKCSDKSQEQITSAGLLTLAAQFQAKIKTKDQAAYFGYFTTTDCCGASASGVCVYYKTVTKADQKVARYITWLQSIRQVATKLQQQQAARQRINGLIRLISAIKGQAFNLKPKLELHKHLAQAMAKTTTAAQKSTQAQGQQKKNQ
uniref:Variant surface glycoprotein 1125.2829 n=1 Tax=Trypanosoma brucei TaxID=5691 RepID=A0A1J0R8M5_9TRYP|nr:variant surface glycoprotein 1125.2829 [Trypanosoma brucei]